ncbi:type VI secretion system-associated FHA domain protein TagH [Sphingomonas sp. LB2R24]|uniref:type VI secretion system-associated FHA domain protein TagH n=1 Tax=Sphingomonas sorbitolis TaxID=3096165 RepID=UPI002FC8C2DF
MNFHLILHHGRTAAGQPLRWPLAGTDCVIGTASDCDWRLDDGVAPRHCQFGYRGGQWLIVDLGGGTAINGRPLDRPTLIAVGDRVTIGGCEVVIVDSDAPGVGAGSTPADALLAAAGLTRVQVDTQDADLIATAGTLVRHLVSGLVDQLAHRMRAKAEMGAEATQFAFGAVNPLKTLPADRALAALLAPTKGMMPADRAVADAFADLEAHQAATLAGMQGALAATLDRFSPDSIRGRTQDGGMLARMLPGARQAALWQAYEREFDGVAKGSSDAFVELFATEFAKAYRTVSSAPRPPS